MLLSYSKREWMVGFNELNKMEAHLEGLQKLIRAIRMMEFRYHTSLQDVTLYSGIPQLKARAQKQADCRKRAALRLKQSFNNIINETAL